MAGPLSGIRILDLTRVLAGPWATQNLGDLGAEVIKIENPAGGDDTRRMGPPFVHDDQTGEVVDASYFLSCNRNKESVTVDISTAEGRELVMRLASKCDVLIENYKVGGLVKYGLDYASVHAELPGLVYCSITGFGQTGPYRKRPGYDYLIQAMGGLMSITGEADGKPGGGPQRVGVALADIMSGMYATIAVLAALRHRDSGGGGQHIDIGMLDVQVAVLANQGMNYLTTGVAPGRIGNSHPNIVPNKPFETSDGQVILSVGNDAQFVRLCHALGLPEVAADSRFRTMADRIANADLLNSLLEAATRTRSMEEWVQRMEAVDVPCGPINDLERVFSDAQVRARGMRIDLPHVRSGKVPTIASPMRLSDTPVEYRQGPPLLGEHTEAVLKRLLNVDESSLARWRSSGVI